MKRKKYVWRVRVTDPGGSEPRGLVPAEVVMESDTGAMVEVLFWPPVVGETRHYLTIGGAQAKMRQWAVNGVAAVIERSDPVTFQGLIGAGGAATPHPNSVA